MTSLIHEHYYNWYTNHNDCVNNYDQFTWKTAIPQDTFLDLVDLVLTITWYTFNAQFYQQTDGVAIVGPASSTTTEIYAKCKYTNAKQRYPRGRDQNEYKFPVCWRY